MPASFRIVRPGGRGNAGTTPTSTDESDEISELEQRISSADLPEHALRAAQKEMKVRVGMRLWVAWEWDYDLGSLGMGL